VSRPESRPERCERCQERIQPGQAYVRTIHIDAPMNRPTRTSFSKMHVSCPTPRQIAHDRRVGRA
jgi:hypothetical protein